MKKFLSNYSLYIAWTVAIAATLGSLYFSEIVGYVPCKLCWIQRIFMYPLTLILGVACYSNDKNVFKYALPLPLIGICFSIYHYALQKIPAMSEITSCGGGIPCNASYVNWYGFITIPFLCLIAFALIITFLFLSRKK